MVMMKGLYEKQSKSTKRKERKTKNQNKTGLSPKLRKVFRNAGYKAVFKSGANLRTILTSKNKTKLPQNSHPGVYKIYCSCGKMYIGETGCKVSTRLQQHQKDLLEKEKKKTTSGVAEHACECDGTVDWSKVETIKVENKRFERKVREALEITVILAKEE